METQGFSLNQGMIGFTGSSSSTIDAGAQEISAGPHTSLVNKKGNAMSEFISASLTCPFFTPGPANCIPPESQQFPVDTSNNAMPPPSLSLTDADPDLEQVIKELFGGDILNCTSSDIQDDGVGVSAQFRRRKPERDFMENPGTTGAREECLAGNLALKAGYFVDMDETWLE